MSCGNFTIEELEHRDLPKAQLLPDLTPEGRAIIEQWRATLSLKTVTWTPTPVALREMAAEQAV